MDIHGVLPVAFRTKNVMIKCSCSDVNGTALGPIRWFDFSGTRIFHQVQHLYVPGTPYFTNNISDDKNVLVIPTFNDTYDGIYTCGVGTHFPPKPSVDINLIFGKQLNLNFISCYKLNIVYSILFCFLVHTCKSSFHSMIIILKLDTKILAPKSIIKYGIT